MKTSSPLDKAVFRRASLRFWSDLDVESLGQLISTKILGGLSFQGLDLSIRDEIPAIFIRNILGLDIILYGFPGPKGYNLSLEENGFPHGIITDVGKEVAEMDLTGNLYYLLQNVERISFESVQ